MYWKRPTDERLRYFRQLCLNNYEPSVSEISQDAQFMSNSQWED